MLLWMIDCRKKAFVLCAKRCNIALPVLDLQLPVERHVGIDCDHLDRTLEGLGDCTGFKSCVMNVHL